MKTVVLNMRCARPEMPLAFRGLRAIERGDFNLGTTLVSLREEATGGCGAGRRRCGGRSTA
jgi:hypothetical protein